jgi:hypothetical protein
MKANRATRAGEPASAQARWGANPPQRILVVEDISSRQLSTEVPIHSSHIPNLKNNSLIQIRGNTCRLYLL